AVIYPAGLRDTLAHEFGHAVCDYTANLAYQRESGALNEGFSDIWGACAKNFIKDTILPLTKKQWIIGDEIAYGTDIGLRSMENPQLKQQPDTYLDLARKWQDVGIEGCPIPEGGPGSNDQCGVHTNSGVLNHWFYLLTNGGTGINGNFFNYTVDSFGFDKTQRIAFYTEQILTPNSGFESARIASQNAVLILASLPNTLGITASDTTNVNKAWKAVGVINDSVFRMSNTPVFASEAFNTVAVGKYGAIWAGTSNNGLYRYDGREWKKAPDLTNHNISDIKADINGRIWIAQYGRTGSQALGGGLGCYNDSAFASYRYYTTDSGLPTRNIRSLYINNLLLFDTFKRVWVAAFADITTGNSRPGFVVRGRSNKTFFDFNYKPFEKIESGVNPNFGYCQTIGGSDAEVWVFASNNGPGSINQILRYKTTDSSFIGFVDNTNSSLPAGFNAKAIYYDSVGKRWWVGMTSGGVYVYNTVSPGWTQINFPSVFPPGTIINNHAITGDTKGNIHIGTSNGYVRFGSVNSSTLLDPADQTLYKTFTRSDGLPSNNVKSIAVDYRASRLIIATDSGILFKYNLCKDCINKVPVYTIATGNWNDPSTWQDGRIPGEFDVIVIRHPVTITQNTNCKSLVVKATGSVTVSAGVIFNVQGVTYEPNANKK
ncbi:MAG: M4 family metallopeptidase, partial [Ferruginibacter sp.]